MAKVTIVFQDNPMAALPGQSDVDMQVSSTDPPLPIAGEDTVGQLSPAQAAAIAAVAHVARMGYQDAWVFLEQGGEN